jgi:hypothetical protein|tara:strand:- start:6907 stop:7221 length:315 start_codon:yes stop_codon:yes gene_type:complete
VGQTNWEGRGFSNPAKAKTEDSTLERNPLSELAFSGEALVKPKPKFPRSDQVSADHARVRHLDGWWQMREEYPKPFGADLDHLFRGTSSDSRGYQQTLDTTIAD